MGETVSKYFQYFYSLVSGHTNYQFRPTMAESKMIQSFLKFMPGITEDVLFDYMSFQFHYWHDKDTRFGRGKIQFNWVVGQKAVNRYRDSENKYWYYFSTVLNEKFGILKSDLIKPKISATMLSVYDYEEADKMLFHNTLEGVIFCSDYTTMWNPKSKACSSCTNVGTCKEVMRKKYSLVYNSRVEAAA